MKEIIVASTNQGKIREIRAMLSQIGIEVKSIQDIFHDDIEIEEISSNYELRYITANNHRIDDFSFLIIIK